MKIYDISQEILSCRVYPGDPAPEKETLLSIDRGDVCNLTAFSMCAHNGTHIDAPFHFLPDGRTVDRLALERTVGLAFVAEYNGVLTAEAARDIVLSARSENAEAARRILLKGRATVSASAAEAFVSEGVWLVGNESQTVGPEDAPMEVHRLLLGAEVVLLEGIRLDDLPCGVYLLSAAPLSIAGADGAPCRAYLIEKA